MSTAQVIGSQEALVQEIAGLLQARERDYSGSLVVFPGRRPAHFLRRELARREQRSFIPPVILSMDGFVDSLAEAAGPVKAVETVDAVAVLYRIHRKSPSPLGGKSFLALDSFFPLGLKLFADIEELHIEGVAPAMVREIQPFADEMIPRHAQIRLQSLSFFYTAFYDEMSRLGVTTRSMRYRIAAAHVHKGIDRYERVILAGFFALTRSERDLFAALLRVDEAYFLFQDGPGLTDRLAELGIDTVNEAASFPEPDCHFYSSPDAHGQVFALGSILKDKRERTGPPDERTAIVLPSSDTLFPLLRHGLPCIDKDDFNVSLGYPLHRTPVFGFLNNLMELLDSMEDDRMYVPAYLNFILHPYVKNIYCKGDAEVTRISFHTIEEMLRKSRTRTFVSLAEIEDSEAIIDAVAERLRQEEEGLTRTEIAAHLRMVHQNTIGRFLSFRDIGDFAVKCTELVDFVFRQSTARLHPLFYPYAESFITALDKISRSLMSEMSFADRTSYFTFFRKYIMTGHVPFPGTPLKGLQVLGFLETRNIRFDTVYILDANDDVIPATSREETLLPLKAREILGLPTYVDRDRLAAYYFDTLVQGAREVHIFFIENDSKERSRFVERLLWERQRRDKSTRAGDYVQAVQYKVTLENDSPAVIPKTEAVAGFLKGFAYSATSLDTYLACPLKFYYSYVLDIGRQDEVTGNIERVDVGRFVHRVLSSFFSKKTNRRLRESDMDPEEMVRLTDDLFDREYGAEPAGAVYLLKAQIKVHLSDYIRKYRIPLISRRNVTILGVEESVDVVLDSYKLKGRLDIVEERDGVIHILDYKTGSSVKNLKIDFGGLDPDDRGSWDEAIGSLQLPFYLMLYACRHGLPAEDLRGAFLLLGRSSITQDIELPLFDPDDAQPDFGDLRRVVMGLLGEITDPAVPFSAAPNKKERCPKCDFAGICGTQWVAG